MSLQPAEFVEVKHEVEDDGDTEESDSGGDSDSEVWRKDDVSEKCPES